jgi:D-lactate dehydrogenase (cytochrome)
MVEYCHRVAGERGILIHTFGHVGMGLLHALMLARRDDESEWATAQEINEKIIRKALEYDGTISGEHGIGLGHKRLFQQSNTAAVDLMRKIKRQFDPRNILNPGKIFDIERQASD